LSAIVITIVVSASSSINTLGGRCVFNVDFLERSIVDDFIFFDLSTARRAFECTDGLVTIDNILLVRLI
jgi:hypothetical protein